MYSSAVQKLIISSNSFFADWPNVFVCSPYGEKYNKTDGHGIK